MSRKSNNAFAGNCGTLPPKVEICKRPSSPNLLERKSEIEQLAYHLRKSGLAIVNHENEIAIIEVDKLRHFNPMYGDASNGLITNNVSVRHELEPYRFYSGTNSKTFADIYEPCFNRIRVTDLPQTASFPRLAGIPIGVHLDNHGRSWFNMAEGIKLPDRVRDEAGLFLVLNHIEKVLCNGDELAFKCFMAACADRIQNYDKPCPIQFCFYFRSKKQGTGKSIILDDLLGLTFAHEHVKSNFGQSSRFNEQLAPARVVYATEGDFNSLLYSSLGSAKDMITAKRITFEGKGKQTAVKDKFFFIVADGNDYKIRVEQEDRRFYIIDCCEDYAGNQEYFATLAALCNSKDFALDFARYLKDYQYDPNLLTMHAPVTDAKRIQQGLNTPRWIEWVENNLESIKSNSTELSSGIEKDAYDRPVKKIRTFERGCKTFYCGSDILDKFKESDRSYSKLSVAAFNKDLVDHFKCERDEPKNGLSRWQGFALIDSGIVKSRTDAEPTLERERVSIKDGESKNSGGYL